MYMVWVFIEKTGKTERLNIKREEMLFGGSRLKTAAQTIADVTHSAFTALKAFLIQPQKKQWSMIMLRTDPPKSSNVPSGESCIRTGPPCASVRITVTSELEICCDQICGSAVVIVRTSRRKKSAWKASLSCVSRPGLRQASHAAALALMSYSNKAERESAVLLHGGCSQDRFTLNPLCYAWMFCR